MRSVACEEGKRTFTACVLLPMMSVSSDGMGGRAPSTIFRYSSAPSRRMLIQSNIVNCVSRSRDSISGRRLLSPTAFSNVTVVVVLGLCGVGVTTFVDADAARAAPRSATCSILPARPRSRENHARTLFHGCDASLEAPAEEDECGTLSTVSIFGGGGGGR